MKSRQHRTKIIIAALFLLLIGCCIWWITPQKEQLTTASEVTSDNCITKGYSVGTYQVFFEEKIVPFALPKWFKIDERIGKTTGFDYVSGSTQSPNTVVCGLDIASPDAYSGILQYKYGKILSFGGIAPYILLLIIILVTACSPLFLHRKLSNKVLIGLMRVYFLSIIITPYTDVILHDTSLVTSLLLFIPALLPSLIITLLVSSILSISNITILVPLYGILGFIWSLWHFGSEKNLYKLSLLMMGLCTCSILSQSLFPNEELTFFFLVANIIYALVFWQLGKNIKSNSHQNLNRVSDT